MSDQTPPPESPQDPQNPYGQPPVPPQNPYGQRPPVPPQNPYGQQPPVPPQNPYGQQPPVPPQNPYGQQPPSANPYGGFQQPPASFGSPNDATAPYSVGEAFSYGWTKFTQNVGTLLGSFGIVFGVVIVLSLVLVIAAAAMMPDIDPYSTETPTIPAGLIVLYFLFFLVVSLFSLFIGIGLTRVALDITAGRQTSIGRVFSTDGLGGAVGTALLVYLGTVVGSILCLVPGIIFGFLCSFAVHFAIDKKLSAVDAIKASIDLTKNNVGSVLVLLLLSAGAVLLGEAACLVGVLIAAPVVLIATAYTYRKLQGEPVAA